MKETGCSQYRKAKWACVRGERGVPAARKVQPSSPGSETQAELKPQANEEKHVIRLEVHLEHFLGGGSSHNTGW